MTRRNKITLIIGAGANKEIRDDIGLGKDLTVDISNRVTDRTVSPKLAYLSKILHNEFSIDLQTREKFLQHLDFFIASKTNPSIDEFLYCIETDGEFDSDRHAFKQIIFVLTVAHVIGWEGTTTKTNIDNEKTLKKTWLTILAEYIRHHDLFDAETLKIVTFNYDRILEYYLLEEFGSKIKDFIKKNIVHVYGRIGKLEGLHPLKDVETTIPIGLTSVPKEYIIAGTENIEFIHSKLTFDHVQVASIVKSSKRIIMFGYGMNSTNNQRLTLSDWADQNGTDGDFIFNIHPDVKTATRELLSDSVTSLIKNPDIQVRHCQSFLNYSLNEKT